MSADIAADREASPLRGWCAFTLVEALVVVAIVGILAGILIPVVRSVRASAKEAGCQSNLRQIGIAWILYANEHNGMLGDYSKGTTYNWGGVYTSWGGPATQDRLLFPYISDPAVFRCPADTGTKPGSEPLWKQSGNSYAVANSTERGVIALASGNSLSPDRSNPGRLNLIEVPAKTILAFDSNMRNAYAGWTVYWHPNGECNAVMADGHVVVFSRAVADTYQNPTNPPGYSWGWTGWSPHSQW